MTNRFLTILVSIFLITSATSCMLAKRVGDAVTAPSTGGFVPNLPDVPLPRHFVVDADTTTFFDSPEGRISDVSAQGFGEPEDVVDFYSDNMAQFGWQKVTDAVYRKDGEMLMINISKSKTLTYIKYQLRPAN